MFKLKLATGLIALALALAMVACDVTESLEVKEGQTEELSELQLIEQETGVDFAEYYLTLESADKKVKADITLAASTKGMLDSYIANNELSLIALNEVPEAVDASVSTETPMASTEGTDYSKGVIVLIDNVVKAAGVAGYQIQLSSKGSVQARTRPGDLTDSFNSQDIYINNNDLGFTIVQPSVGLPPAPLDRLGIEFWYKRKTLFPSWKLDAYVTIGAGQSRTDSRTNDRKIQVVVGRETVSILYSISFF